MFESLDMAPPDSILGLNEAFQRDTRANKINLSVGVYKDGQGKTPVLKCVKEAERRILEQETSKNYLAIEGMAEYGRQASALLFGPQHEIITSGRSAVLQTPGGTGALRIAADFIKRRFPQSAIWLSKPTWANHPSVFQAADRRIETYDYVDASLTGLDFASMMRSVSKIPRGDVVLLHACCHNPTGIDPTVDQWREIADLIQNRGLLPLVDCAYQGFGDGLEEDVAGLRALCRPGQELLICSSFSKNFGLYGERVGALTIVAGDRAQAEAAMSHARVCVRVNYSNPPTHGAAIVAAVLSDPQLRAQWQRELAEMRGRIHNMRSQFVKAMAAMTSHKDFSFIARQRGMFSYSGLTPVQVDELRVKHAIYIVTQGGRINVAGMHEASMDRLCDAIASVLGP